MTIHLAPMARRAAMPIALLLVGLGGTPALAQQPSQAQVNAIRSACRADYQAHCASVQPGGSAALACLQKNAAALSPGCQKAVAAAGGASAPAQRASDVPAAPPPANAAASASAPASTPAAAPSAANTPAPAAPAAAARGGAGAPAPAAGQLVLLRRACGADVQANCPGVRPGGGEVIGCLVANQATLSPICRRALAAARDRM